MPLLVVKLSLAALNAFNGKKGPNQSHLYKCLQDHLMNVFFSMLTHIIKRNNIGYTVIAIWII